MWQSALRQEKVLVCHWFVWGHHTIAKWLPGLCAWRHKGDTRFRRNPPGNRLQGRLHHIPLVFREKARNDGPNKRKTLANTQEQGKCNDKGRWNARTMKRERSKLENTVPRQTKDECLREIGMYKCYIAEMWPVEHY